MDVDIARLEEAPQPGRRLGRHVQHDPRSRQHPAERAPTIVSVTHRAVGLPLDQGNLGSCTANALCGALDTEPDRTGRPIYREADAVHLYEVETALEGLPYPPNDPGGTGLLVCQAARQLGLISSYTHAFGLTHALEALVLRPVITGISWYSSFDTPDPATGEVTIGPDAFVRGGHEVVVTGLDVEARLVWCWNSWGRGWGLGGRFALGYATWERLLHEQGDVTVPIV